MVIILMISVKMATPGLLKTTVFWNKRFDVIVPPHDVTSKILSRDSNYIIDVVMWPKFGNSSIFVKEVSEGIGYLTKNIKLSKNGPSTD